MQCNGLYNYDDDGTEIGTTGYTSIGIDTDPRPIGGGEFTVVQLQQSPLVSTISFSAQSNINGYTITCSDGVNSNDSIVSGM